MKTFKHLLLLCALVALVACSEDTLAPQNEVIPTAEGGSVDLISMVVPDIEIDDAMTRSKLIDDGTELKFIWQENDAIGVVPLNGSPLHFPINAENAGKNTALFDGGDWALKANGKYAAFFPMNADNLGTNIHAIAIDYTGQTQGNWMKYDFMATGAVQPKDGAVTFTMKRLSAILKIRVNVDADVHVRYCSLKADDAVFNIKGTLDLSGTNPVYTPKSKSKSINTDLGVNKVSTDEEFTFYFMIPPTDLSGKMLTLSLNSDSGMAKEAEFEGKNFEAGKAYDIDAGYIFDPFIRNANLIEAAGLSDLVVGAIVNVWANRERILKVEKIDVNDKNDPTVCEEIGYFRNLKELRCVRNQITSLDVSNNPALEYLGCGDNPLNFLDISNNLALTNLHCFNNQLTSLDISDKPALTKLTCSKNKLTTLDVSNNLALEDLDCEQNRLTSLDVSNNTALISLDCLGNQLTSLDVSNNTALETLVVRSNRLTSLDVSNNPALTFLNCMYNRLTSLDISNNPALRSLSCSGNLLTSLDASNKPALFLLNCDDNQLTSLDVSNDPELNQINCSNNQFVTLTITNHPKFWYINVTNNPKLTSLDCSNNILSSLTLTGCTALKSLDCNKNRMTKLDISSFFPTLTRYNVFCGNQMNADGENQVMTLTHHAQDNTTFREPTLRNWYVTLVPNE